jgi:hypothetical protein
VPSLVNDQRQGFLNIRTDRAPLYSGRNLTYVSTRQAVRVGADQFLLPHLGTQARVLLDRIVASGADGVHRRDADGWVLSRLVDLRYAEESHFDARVFVCTPAGKHRWLIEIQADELRDAAAQRRQIIRHRLDERFSRLGISTSTALTPAYSPVEPRLHRGAPALSGSRRQTKMRLASALATLFAAGAAALVVITANTEPRDVQDWLFPPALHAAAARREAPKAIVEQAALVAAPAVDAVGAPVDEVPPIVQRSAAAPIDSSASSHKPDYDGIIGQPEQHVGVPDDRLANIEDAGSEAVATADAASPDDHAILNVAVTAAALTGSGASASGEIAADLATGVQRNIRSITAGLISSAVSESGQIASDLATGAERGFRSIAGFVLHAIADMARPAFALDPVTQRAGDAVPAPVAPVTGTRSETAQPATTQAVITSGMGSDRPGTVHAATDRRVTAKAPAARADDASVDPQHAVVERLNLLSLAAARQGHALRPNTPGIVAEAGRNP